MKTLSKEKLNKIEKAREANDFVKAEKLYRRAQEEFKIKIHELKSNSKFLVESIERSVYGLNSILGINNELELF